MATPMITTRMTRLTTASRFRVSRRNASDQSPRWRPALYSTTSSRAIASVARILLSDPDPRINQRVEDVHQEVCRHDDHREEDRRPHDYSVVPRADRGDEVAPHTVN